jgi:hypothetical protein
MTSATLNHLVEAVGHISAGKLTLSRSDELLRNLGLNHHPKQWERAIASWERQNANLRPSHSVTRDKVRAAHDVYLAMGYTAAAAVIQEAGELYFRERWSEDWGVV